MSPVTGRFFFLKNIPGFYDRFDILHVAYELRENDNANAGKMRL